MEPSAGAVALDADHLDVDLFAFLEHVRGRLDALVRDFETQFMCGDSLLVAPILRDGGDVEIALPPGNWYDLNTRQRFAGRQVIRYRAKMDQFPVFGCEGHALPLGNLQFRGQKVEPRALKKTMLLTVGASATTSARSARRSPRMTSAPACGPI